VPIPVPAYDARELVGGGTQATLLLDRQAYTLRVTRAGKLILTK
jgi:hemin uptake protein HemP